LFTWGGRLGIRKVRLNYESFFRWLGKTSSGTFVACIGLNNRFTFNPPYRWCSFDAPSHSLKDSNVNLKVKIKEKIVGVCSLVHNTLGVKGHAGALGWGLAWVISTSIIHIDLHKPNNKLVSGLLEHFWCTDESWTYIDSQNSPQLKLGGSHHLPLYNIIWD
jgi:hypothetical protein